MKGRYTLTKDERQPDFVLSTGHLNKNSKRAGDDGKHLPHPIVPRALSFLPLPQPPYDTKRPTLR